MTIFANYLTIVLHYGSSRWKVPIATIWPNHISLLSLLIANYAKRHAYVLPQSILELNHSCSIGSLPLCLAILRVLVPHEIKKGPKCETAGTQIILYSSHFIIQILKIIHNLICYMQKYWFSVFLTLFAQKYPPIWSTYRCVIPILKRDFFLSPLQGFKSESSVFRLPDEFLLKVEMDACWELIQYCAG